MPVMLQLVDNKLKAVCSTNQWLDFLHLRYGREGY